MIIRKAEFRDAAGIAHIENWAIEHTYAHFGTEPVEEDRILSALASHPCFIADADGELIGFARCGPWKSRAAYDRTTEVGVYVHPNYQGRGVARALYAELFPSLSAAGFHTLLAGIALPNEPSVRLHEAFGMTHVGTLPKVGFKLGAWRDVGYWARVL